MCLLLRRWRRLRRRLRRFRRCLGEGEGRIKIVCQWEIGDLKKNKQENRKRQRNVPIDHHNHARLTVICLRTIQKHGLGIGNGHDKGPDGARRRIKGDKAAVDALVRGRGLARRGRIALRDGVVARGKLELDHVARLRRDQVGRKGERVAADEDRDEARG